jgi:hypothetical protein
VLARSLRKAVALLTLVCSACLSDHPVRRLDSGRELPWLVEGQTTRAQIEEQLGPSDASHEDGRIRTWWLDPWNQHARKDAAWDVRSLEVFFDEQQRAVHVRGRDLPWLVEGTTTRAEIEQRIGPPGEVYNADGRACLWWFDANGIAVRAEPAGRKNDGPRSLVVVFGEGERAQRVSLVQLW